MSLAERCQLLECSNFGDSTENGSSHPLFSSMRNYGVLSYVQDAVKRKLRTKFNSCGLLPGIELSNVYNVSWIVCHGTKFCKDGVIICHVTDSLLPIMGSIKQIWVVSDFIYFEYLQFETLCFSDIYQAYKVKEISDTLTHSICSYESLVDYNVFHVHVNHLEEMYIPVKYDICDLMEQHVKGKNPLKFKITV